MKDIDALLVSGVKKYEKFILDRSFQMDQFDKNSCVTWLGKVDDLDRPVLRIDGAEITVRSAVYMIIHNRTHPSMNFGTTCDNPHCVNPRHMKYVNSNIVIAMPVAKTPAPVTTVKDQQLHLIPATVESTGPPVGVKSLLR